MRFALIPVCTTLAVFLVSESKADLINYNFTGYVSSTFLPTDFPLKASVPVSFTLDTGIIGVPNVGNAPFSLRYEGAVSNFQFGSISLGGPPFDSNYVVVTDGFNTNPNYGYIDLLWIQVNPAPGQGALVFLQSFDYSTNPPFLTSLDIPTAPDISLATSSFISYNVGQQQIILSLSPVSDIPEPSTWVLFILGFAGVGFMSYWRRKPAAALAAA